MRNVEYIISLRDKFTKTLKGINRGLSDSEKRVNLLNNSLRQLAPAFSLVAAAAATRDIVKTTAEWENLENAIKFLSGTAEQGDKSMQFLRDTADELGLDALALSEGFKTLAGGFTGTGVSIDKVREIFKQTSVAASALQLNSERTKLVMLALGQIASKGVVSMEELRRQLGDSIPGALQRAADAMGVTIAEINELVESGEVLSSDFLPKFAAELQKTFEGALPKSTASLQSALNRMGNSIRDLKLLIGQELAPSIIKASDKVKMFTKWVRQNWDAIKRTVKIVAQVVKWILIYRGTVLALRIAFRLATITQTAFRIATIAMSKGLKSAIVLTRSLNLALASNAIGLAVAALGFLISSLANVSSNAKKAALSQDELNDALLRTEEIAKRRKLLTFLKEIGLARKVFTGTDPFSGRFEGNLKNLNDAVKNVKSLEEIQSLTQIIEDGIGQIRREKLNKLDEVTDKNIRRQVVNLFDDRIAKLQAVIDALKREEAKFGDGGAGTKNLTTKETRVTSSAPKVFNINIDSLVKEQNIITENLEEDPDKIKEIVTRLFLSAVNEAQLAVR